MCIPYSEKIWGPLNLAKWPKVYVTVNTEIRYMSQRYGPLIVFGSLQNHNQFSKITKFPK